MRTAVISDLHLGARRRRRHASPAGRFATSAREALDGVDRLVLLGDVVELRDRPLAEALAAPRRRSPRLGEIVAGAEVVIVAGNHDHHLVERWLEDRALDDAAPLGLEHRRARPGGSAG